MKISVGELFCQVHFYMEKRYKISKNGNYQTAVKKLAGCIVPKFCIHAQVSMQNLNLASILFQIHWLPKNRSDVENRLREYQHIILYVYIFSE